MAMVVRSEGHKINSNINVTPMVDVMLVLLIIFMVVTPLLHPWPQVEMAKAEHSLLMPDADRDDIVLIAINREGVVFFGNDQIKLADLTEKIRDRIASRSDGRVFVKADARARYRAVVEVVDQIQSAGASQLGLLTEPKRE